MTWCSVFHKHVTILSFSNDLYKSNASQRKQKYAVKLNTNLPILRNRFSRRNFFNIEPTLVTFLPKGSGPVLTNNMAGSRTLWRSEYSLPRLSAWWPLFCDRKLAFTHHAKVLTSCHFPWSISGQTEHNYLILLWSVIFSTDTATVPKLGHQSQHAKHYKAIAPRLQQHRKRLWPSVKLPLSP